MQILVIDLKGLRIISNLYLPFSAAETYLQSELRQVLAAWPSVVVIIRLNKKKLFSVQFIELVLCILWFTTTFTVKFPVWLTLW